MNWCEGGCRKTVDWIGSEESGCGQGRSRHRALLTVCEANAHFGFSFVRTKLGFKKNRCVDDKFLVRSAIPENCDLKRRNVESGCDEGSHVYSGAPIGQAYQGDKKADETPIR